jgi:glycosyltransferase involved in cell wall biosynthesis
MNQNVLYISYDGLTDPLGQSQILPYLIGLSKEGYSFHIISFEKPARFEQHKDFIQEICDTNNIVWHPLTYTKKPPLLSTMWDVHRMKKCALRLHKEHSFSIVHCRSYLSALVGLRLQRKGVKFVFDMRGFWADERIEGGIWRKENPVFRTVYNYFKRKERLFFQKADKVISLTQTGKDEILSWKKLAITSDKITVIPCCVDTVLFDPETINPHQKRELKKSLGIKEEDFVLGYVGSIGTWYMLDEMLDCFNVITEKKSTAKMIFVTGESPNEIIEKATAKGIERSRLIFTSTVHKYVPLHISLFDWSIFFIRPTFSKKASSPTKQGEIMAMGVPVICNAGVGDTDKIVHDYQSGIVLNELNETAYRQLELTAYNSTKLRQGAIEFFSLEEGVRRYAAVYAAFDSAQSA